MFERFFGNGMLHIATLVQKINLMERPILTNGGRKSERGLRETTAQEPTLIMEFKASGYGLLSKSYYWVCGDLNTGKVRIKTQDWF